jgi:hypothetical protein
MPRYKFVAYAKSTSPRFIVLWDLQWQILHCQRVDPHTDLCAAMTATLHDLEAQGWQTEGDVPYGFVFIRRGAERRMLMLTPSNPFDSSPQSFDPFRT